MILYGRKSTLLTRQSVPNDCNNCGAADSIDFTVYQKYGCVFGIPFLPLGKMPLTECSNCRQVLDKAEFTLTMNEQYELIKRKSCTPVWTFSGLILLSFFLLCIIL